MVSRSSIALPAGDPFAGPLPGTEVVVLNLAKALAARGVDVRFFGAVSTGTVVPGVATCPLSDFESYMQVAAPTTVLWVRDYVLSVSTLARFSAARHVLLCEDATVDVLRLLDRPVDVVGAWFRRYLPQFCQVVFASRWHLDSWRDSFGLDDANSVAIYNLASHAPWLDGPLDRNRARAVHTSHPRKALAMVGAVASRLSNVDVTVSSSPRLYQESTSRIAVVDGAARQHCSFEEFEARFSTALTFADAVPVREMAHFLDQFGALIHPDESTEVGATAVIEALRRGLVPVVSDLGALPELVGDAGLVVDRVPDRGAYADRFAATLDALPGIPHSFETARRERRHVLDTDPIVRQWESVLL